MKPWVRERRLQSGSAVSVFSSRKLAEPDKRCRLRASANLMRSSFSDGLRLHQPVVYGVALLSPPGVAFRRCNSQRRR